MVSQQIYTIINVKPLSGAVSGFYAWFKDDKGVEQGEMGQSVAEAIGNLILARGLKLRSPLTVAK